MSAPLLTLAKKTILIGSGKGGVGKSTIAVNLAIALAKSGLSTALLDADIYGPSIPIMMGLRSLSPRTDTDATGKETIIPLTKFGVKTLSIGFFLEEARSMVARGPLLQSILQKMICCTSWGDLDCLLIDLPPGTGDILFSLSQLISIDGALVVCTPQEVAIIDAVKAINAFDQFNIPLLGIIENMAGFTAPDTGQTYHLFGQGKGKELAERCDIPLLASIPLTLSIRVGGDEGCPAAIYEESGQPGSYFHDLAQQLLETAWVR